MFGCRFIYKSLSNKGKLCRKNKKSRDKIPCVNNADIFTESESNSRVDSLLVNDQVKIPVVSKAKAKINTSIIQERQKEIDQDTLLKYIE